MLKTWEMVMKPKELKGNKMLVQWKSKQKNCHRVNLTSPPAWNSESTALISRSVQSWRVFFSPGPNRRNVSKRRNVGALVNRGSEKNRAKRSKVSSRASTFTWNLAAIGRHGTAASKLPVVLLWTWISMSNLYIQQVNPSFFSEAKPHVVSGIATSIPWTRKTSVVSLLCLCMFFTSFG